MTLCAAPGWHVSNPSARRFRTSGHEPHAARDANMSPRTTASAAPCTHKHTSCKVELRSSQGIPILQYNAGRARHTLLAKPAPSRNRRWRSPPWRRRSSTERSRCDRPRGHAVVRPGEAPRAGPQARQRDPQARSLGPVSATTAVVAGVSRAAFARPPPPCGCTRGARGSDRSPSVCRGRRRAASSSTGRRAKLLLPLRASSSLRFFLAPLLLSFTPLLLRLPRSFLARSILAPALRSCPSRLPRSAPSALLFPRSVPSSLLLLAPSSPFASSFLSSLWFHARSFLAPLPLAPSSLRSRPRSLRSELLSQAQHAGTNGAWVVLWM